MKLIWYAVLIRAIPEAIGTTLLTLTIIEEKKSVKDVLLVSILCGISAFIMRLLPIKFGIHILITLAMQVFIMNIVFKVKIQMLFKCVLICMIILMASEMLTIVFIQTVLKIDPKEVFANLTGILLAGLPSVLVLYLTTFIIYNFKNNRYVGKDVVCNDN